MAGFLSIILQGLFRLQYIHLTGGMLVQVNRITAISISIINLILTVSYVEIPAYMPCSVFTEGHNTATGTVSDFELNLGSLL